MLKNKYILGGGIAGILLMLLLVYVLVFRKKELPAGPHKFEQRLAHIPERFKADDKLSLKIKPLKGCLLKANVVWGTLAFSLDSSLVLPRSIVAEAGIHKLSVWCNGTKMEEKKMEVLPLESYGILASYIGSKSITADQGIHWSMLSVLPVDTYKNMVDDGTPIDIQATRPNGSYQEVKPLTKNGIAYLRINSQSTTGKTFLASSTTHSDSKEKELLELPNIPNSFSLSTSTKLIVADGRQYFKVTTSNVLDRYGNRVSDGVLLRFIVVDQDGLQSIYRAFVLDGIASANIKYPSRKGSLTVYAIVDNVLKSSSISLKVLPYVADFDLKFNVKNSKLFVGPVLAKMGQYVTDGTEVRIFRNQSPHEFLTFLKDGVASYDLFRKVKLGDTLSVEIGGVSKVIIAR